MKQAANRHALTLCNRRTSHNFTDFCNFDSKMWKSSQDTVRVTLFFLIRSSHARSVCRAIYRHKETAQVISSHIIRLMPLLSCSIVLPMSIQAGSSKHVTIPRYKYANTAVEHVRCRKDYKQLPTML